MALECPGAVAYAAQRTGTGMITRPALRNLRRQIVQANGRQPASAAR
jgi:hypothetical protein